ncbi:hypothetical protein GCM10009836_21690 [Pseudonocardia ailaonensis]|uniref:Uncharacterized protein n=1 Tax=Pseudonocardia ailaonensis TaxID=367279 RepID=A0ABN2MWU8_9PSEU
MSEIVLVGLPGAAPAGTAVLAQDPAPPAGKGEEFGSASPVALVVILCLAAATIALVVSMSRRIRRLPKSFDEESADGEAPVDQEQPKN